MKKTFAELFLALLTFNLFAQTNVLYTTVADYSLTPGQNIAVKLTLTYPNPRTWNGVLVRSDAISHNSDTNGYVSFTNILWGRYSVDVSGAVGTHYTIVVDTNSLGTLPIVSLITNTLAHVPNQGTNYYTQQQIDAMLAQSQIGANATNVFVGNADGSLVAITNQLGGNYTLRLAQGVTNQITATNTTAVAPGVVAAGNGVTVTRVGNSNIISVYTVPTIVSFSNNRNSVEKGSSVASTLLTWVLGGGSITSQSIDQGVGLMDIATHTTNHVQTYSADRTYTLTTSDGVITNTATTSITFLSKAYWGVSSLTSLADSDILSLASSAFASSRNNSFSLSPANQYIYLAYPASFGSASFTVNGLPNTDWTLVTRSFVNSSSFGSSYNIYRNNSLLTGTFSVIVQ